MRVDATSVLFAIITLVSLGKPVSIRVEMIASVIKHSIAENPFNAFIARVVCWGFERLLIMGDHLSRPVH